MRIVSVHAKSPDGLFGDAVAAICAEECSPVLLVLPGERQHVGVASYRIVIRALELAEQAGEAIEVHTSYQVIAGHLNKNRCGSQNLMPLFRRARQLLEATGSRVSYVPAKGNAAVAMVMEEFRRLGVYREPVAAPSEARTRPVSPNLPPRVRAGLIAAGWTPPAVPAMAS